MTDTQWEVELRGRLGDLDIDIAFTSGSESMIVVVGPNGAGKTTLLRAIAGAPTELTGRVRLRGRILMDTDDGVWLPPEARRVGYLPQGFGLFPHLRALDNVAFGCGRGRRARQQARTWLEHLDVAHLADRRPASLSGGEQQRIALARALAIDPMGLLLDEPLAALDVGKRRRVRTLLAERLRRADRPTIIVTHDVRDVLTFGGWVVVVESGRVVQTGKPRDLADQPTTDFVAELFERVTAEPITGPVSSPSVGTAD